MAKASRKNSAAAQRSKHRLPQPDAGELGCPSHFEALARHREWKGRLYGLINTHYFKTPLKERQWFKLLDIAAECARISGTTNIDDDKRNSMVDFLCRAIDRGEFKDGKGRMQVANLHPSPHVSIRLELKWLDFDPLVAFAKQGYLFIRRKECIECFSQNNIDFPAAWLPSELSGPDVPNTRNLPAQTIVTADQAAPKTGLVRWLKNEVSQLTATGKLPDRITDCARLLEAQLSTAADSDKSLRRVKARHIENELRTHGLFPKTRRK